MDDRHIEESDALGFVPFLQRGHSTLRFSPSSFKYGRPIIAKILKKQYAFPVNRPHGNQEIRIPDIPRLRATLSAPARGQQHPDQKSGLPVSRLRSDQTYSRGLFEKRSGAGG